ncbi:hypothetical protein VL03_22050 [Rossellomorea marisflavi]|nr:hypothetical protein VL03_22050 [Rossellomorea marisflavi]
MPEINERTVHYLSYYIDKEYAEHLEGSMAVLPKVEYVRDSIRELNLNIRIVSTAGAKKGIGSFLKNNKQVTDQESHIYFSSYGAKTKIGRLFSRMWVKAQLVLYLIKNVKKEDSILIYHSLQYIWPIRIFKMIKNNKIIFQVEEIYSDAYKKFSKYKKKEMNFLSNGDSYICINENVQDIITGGKPSTVLYGDYRIPPLSPKQIIYRKKIKAVYAGVIEPTRIAAETAVNAARYLNENYLIHIAGFGKDEDINSLKKLIEQINLELGYIGVIYDGAFQGEVFREYLQDKDIGLNCHSYSDEDLISAEVTFPSKILVYLTSGLKVISPRINCLENSDLENFIEFYEGFDAEDLAKVIFSTSAKITNQDSIFSQIELLDKNFKMQLSDIM